MTEEEWLLSKDIKLMIGTVRTSKRRIRLFAVGCCLRIWHLLDATVQEAILTAERYTDGTVNDAQLEAMNVAATLRHGSRQRELAGQNKWVTDRELAGPACALYITARNFKCLIPLTECVWRLSAAIAALETQSLTRRKTLMQKTGQTAAANEIEGQAQLVRSFFGNPFRPITLDPSWLTSTVVALAKQMYDTKDFSAMPILADALQDGGCDNEEMLNHCREPGVHVRGCYCVDLILAKG